jgi:hypothetical protein
MQIDRRDRHEKKPLFPIRLSCDAGPNVITKSDLQSAKQLSPSDSIDEEMENDVRERSVTSFCSIVVTILSVDEAGTGERVIQFGDGRFEAEASMGI